MQNLLEAIHAAVVPDATAEARAAGAAACRTILTALDAQPGEPMMATSPGPSQIASIVGALRGVPADQLLDLAIAKLRSMLPAAAKVEPVAPLKFVTVPLPRRG